MFSDVLDYRNVLGRIFKKETQRVLERKNGKGFQRIVVEYFYVCKFSDIFYNLNLFSFSRKRKNGGICLCVVILYIMCKSVSMKRKVEEEFCVHKYICEIKIYLSVCLKRNMCFNV